MTALITGMMVRDTSTGTIADIENGAATGTTGAMIGVIGGTGTEATDVGPTIAKDATIAPTIGMEMPLSSCRHAGESRPFIVTLRGRALYTV